MQAEAASASLARQAARLGRAVALVDLEHRQAEAAPQLAPELERTRGILVRGTVRMVGHADHQRVGLPFLDALCHLGEARVGPRP